MSHHNNRENNDCKVYVGNLPGDIRTRDLDDLFYKYGKVVDVDLHADQHNKRGQPFAFVEFEDPRSVTLLVICNCLSSLNSSQRC